MRPTFVSAALAVALIAACGPALPPRYVLERDVEGYDYRRYQEVLDIEFVVDGNPAVGHTASYVARDDAGIHVATAFVTVYEHAASLAAEIKDRLDTLASYERRVVRIDGEYVHRLRASGEEWLVWVSGRYVVKLGAPNGREVPAGLAEAYLHLYPSDLDRSGRARRGADSAGASEHAADDAEAEPALPSNLR